MSFGRKFEGGDDANGEPFERLKRLGDGMTTLHEQILAQRDVLQSAWTAFQPIALAEGLENTPESLHLKALLEQSYTLMQDLYRSLQELQRQAKTLTDDGYDDIVLPEGHDSSDWDVDAIINNLVNLIKEFMELVKEATEFYDLLVPSNDDNPTAAAPHNTR